MVAPAIRQALSAQQLEQFHRDGFIVVRQLLSPEQVAEKGCTFLVIYAPGELETERAMNVVRRVPFEFVHRYQRFAIQVLK